MLHGLVKKHELRSDPIKWLLEHSADPQELDSVSCLRYKQWFTHKYRTHVLNLCLCLFLGWPHCALPSHHSARP